VKLVIADDHAGLKAALRSHLPEAKRRMEAFKAGLGEQVPEAASSVEAGVRGREPVLRIPIGT